MTIQLIVFEGAINAPARLGLNTKEVATIHPSRIPKTSAQRVASSSCTHSGLLVHLLAGILRSVEAVPKAKFLAMSRLSRLLASLGSPVRHSQRWPSPVVELQQEHGDRGLEH